MPGQLAIPGFNGRTVFPVIGIHAALSVLETAITEFSAEFTIIITCYNAVKSSIFIPEHAGLVQCHTLAAEIHVESVIRCPAGMDAVHDSIGIFIILEIHFRYETTGNNDLVIDLGVRIDAQTACPSIRMIFSSIKVMLVLHAGIAGPGNVADFLFQVAYADAEVSQFISVFPCQFVQGCFLFCIQLVFTSHQTGDNLRQFITGHVSFAFECTVRIAFYNALIREIGHCLISPVVRGYIRERISSVCGYACGECSSCCDCENLFHYSCSFRKNNMSSIFSGRENTTRVTVFPLFLLLFLQAQPKGPRLCSALFYHTF